MKRMYTLEQLRETVLARITKGDAFRLTNEQYRYRQQTVATILEAMDAKTLVDKYPEYCYDVKGTKKERSHV